MSFSSKKHKTFSFSYTGQLCQGYEEFPKPSITLPFPPALKPSSSLVAATQQDFLLNFY